MFGFLKKKKNANEDVSNDAHNLASDGKYKAMVTEYPAEELKMLVDYEEEPYVLSVDELKYMLSICKDDQKKGVICYAIATCYYYGSRGAVKSDEKGMEYDKQGMEANNVYSTMRYGAYLAFGACDDVKAGKMSNEEARLRYTLGVGYVVQSYRRGCEQARKTLEIFMEGEDEFYGAHSVDELVRIWPESFN